MLFFFIYVYIELNFVFLMTKGSYDICNLCFFQNLNIIYVE